MPGKKRVGREDRREIIPGKGETVGSFREGLIVCIYKTGGKVKSSDMEVGSPNGSS